MLRLERINVFYEDFQALWDVSLHVEEGEIVTLVGANGAGKTTILRTISGLLLPRSGSIEFFGQRIEREPPHRRVEMGIAQVPEGRELFPYMTVLENLKLGAYTSETRKKERDNLKLVYDLFPSLKARTSQLAGTLSGGEQQMLAMARGLLSNPKLYLLDEPSLGLMPTLVLQVFSLIERIRDEGKTIILVEQNVRNALTITDRAYVLDNGKITKEGIGRELIGDEGVRKAYMGL